MHSLGRYEIIEEIGRGGEGVVYLAVDPSIDRKVAIKTLPIAEDPNGTLRAKLRQEAKSTARLHHPNIVTVFEFAQQDELAYIVMEYVDGKSLAAALQAGESFDPRTICRCLMQAASALDHAHAEGVIHRDVKPENLLINSRGTLKVADFGIAKVLDDVNRDKTKTGTIRGTPFYLSPEQINLSAITGKSDQFALAVVAYQWIAGRRPFQADSWMELFIKVTTHEPAPLEDEAVNAVFRRALSKDPGLRFATCEEFISELQFALGVSAGDLRAPSAATIQTAAVGSAPAPTPSPTKTFVSVQTPPSQSAPIAPSHAPAPTADQPAPPPARSRGPLIGVAATALIALSAVVFYRPAPEQPSPVPPPAVEQSKPPETVVVPEVTATQTAPARTTDPAPKREAPKKAEPAKESPAPQVPAPPPPRELNVPQPTAPALAAEPPKYFGPPAGSFSWSGNLAPGQTVTISAANASSGALQGRGLPPYLEVSVTTDPPGVQVLSQPAQANGYKLTLKNASSADVQNVVIRWREKNR